jgi:uncharacterized protein (TIGR02271 family)
MTMQGTDLTGAQVTDAGGKVVGKVDKVFNDDLDGKPVWALIRAGKASRFIPVRGSRMTADGFSIPFDSQKIMSGPDMNVDQHMSADQVAELRRYYGLTVPAQAGQSTGEQAGQQTGQPTSGQAGQPTSQQAAPTSQQATPQTGQQAGRADLSSAAADVWLVRHEERMDVGTEVLESSRVRLRKHVDVEPVEQAVHVFHEEYEVEHIPITPEERARGPIAENDQELVLHEQRAVFTKEAVPVERVRLVAKRVEEDRKFRDELRKERIEVVPDGDTATPRAGQMPEQNEHRSMLGRHRSLSASARAGLPARGRGQRGAQPSGRCAGPRLRPAGGPAQRALRGPAAEASGGPAAQRRAAVLMTRCGADDAAQARFCGPRLIIWSAMMARWTSLVPSQIRSTRSSRKNRSATFSRM